MQINPSLIGLKEEIVISPSKKDSAISIITSSWSHIKDRAIAVITHKSTPSMAALTAGFILGASIVWIIDHFFHKQLQRFINVKPYASEHCHEYWREKVNIIEQASPAEKHLQNRIKVIFNITITALLFVGGMALTAWQIYDKQNTFLPLAAGGLGFALGTQFFENYTKNTEFRKQKFIQQLKQKGYVDTACQLDLSYYFEYLRYWNLMEKGKEFYETFGPHNSRCHSIVFRGCQLKDDDLKSLKDGNWFSFFHHINISDNSQITAKGIKWIGQSSSRQLWSLNLSRTDLTDDDLIEMADSGYFNDLRELIIRHNPRLTGKAIAYIGKKGFNNLEMLDIGDNSHLFGKELDVWIGQGGFANLTALGLSHSSITENDLKLMIEKSEWFKKLKGLDLDSSANLKRIPSNISEMKNLASANTHFAYMESRPAFSGSGLFLRDCSKEFEMTPEVLDLLNTGKVGMSPFSH